MKVLRIEVQAFRSFRERQVVDLRDANLALIYGLNSHGKTSFAEAMEFLFTGSFSRREVYSACRRDFRDSLRNTTAPDSLQTEVLMVLRDGGGRQFTVRRVMTNDCTQSEGPQSKLYVDGTESGSSDLLTALRAQPRTHHCAMLFQHTLRLIATLKPKERVEYFKAILDIDDLDRFRDLVLSEAQRIEHLQGKAPVPVQLAAEFPDSKLASMDVSAFCDVNVVRRQIAAEMAQLAALAGHKISAESPLSARQEFEAILQRLRLGAFPVQELNSGQPDLARAGDLASAVNGLSSKAKTLAQIRRTQASLAPALKGLYEAVTALYGTEPRDRPTDCPLCQSKEALTPARLSAIQGILQGPRLVDDADAAVRKAQIAITSILNRMGEEVRRTLPKAVQWPGDRARQLDRLLAGTEGTLTPWRDALSHLVVSAKRLQVLVSTIQDAVGNAQVSCAGLVFDAATVEAAISRLVRAREDYVGATETLRSALIPALDQQQQLKRWPMLIALWDNTPEIAAECVRYERRRDLAMKLREAVEQIDAAKAKILDHGIDVLGERIRYWWNMLRPGEPVYFSGFDRRGEGINYLDMKAEIGSAGKAVKRDAVGLFSDSQLNCLGLSVFAAQAQSEGVPIIVFDDPIQSLDIDHQAYFTREMLNALVGQDRQVIVLTHSRLLWQEMQDELKALKPWVGSLQAPGGCATQVLEGGCGVLETVSLAERRLQDDTVEARRGACFLGRSALEFLLKSILVDKRRKAGEDAALRDYSGTTVKPLVAKMDEGGFWDSQGHRDNAAATARRLNPGNHDAEVPGRGDIKTALGDIKGLFRSYKPVT